MKLRRSFQYLKKISLKFHSTIPWYTQYYNVLYYFNYLVIYSIKNISYIIKCRNYLVRIYILVPTTFNCVASITRFILVAVEAWKSFV
jgi:hypothetical protein